MAERKEDVVISGIGGLFPECNNVDELKDLLFNKVNGVTIDSRRWKPNELGVAAGTGKLKNIDKFDATFFSAHPKLAEVMDAMTRIFIERSIEAVIDAGLSPLDLYGSNTAVFTGSAISETEMYSLDSSKTAAFSMLGRSRTMQANRVSYILNLIGPSYTMDGGWICGSNGLEKAKEMIETGVIKSAIVGVTNLVLRPEIQFQFQGLNRLNQGFHTKPFCSDADGYNRSEACIVMLLQRASEAKRSWGTLLSVKSLQFGDHRGHLTEHTGSHFKSLLLDAYKEASIDPATVEYVEAYGSGIKADDSMELNVMEEVFCTEQRKTPLKVGSVKSNVGHCEASGLFMSIVKAVIALDSGYIPPNINYMKPNENVSALKTGKIQVITEKTRFVSDVIGISSFGILNAFSHVILKRNNKVKNSFKDNSDYVIPRLILASGRNEKNARETVNKINSHGNDAEFIALTNGVFTKNINAHFYRCFSIFPKLDDSRIDDVWNVNLKKRPVWFIFSGMGSQWPGMGTYLMKLPIFAEAIDKCDSILKPRGVDIKTILTSLDPKIFDNILNSFVGIAAVQIGLVEVLKALDITPDGIMGHSVGELGCAYADGCFTAEEMILSAYSRGRASLETELIPGMMAAVGLGYDQIKDRLPHDIDVACHNSATSCTISGPVDNINAFVTELKSEGIFAKAVNVAGIAYHSRYIQSAGPTLLKYLKQVIREPKTRSSKWISSSLPETEWNTDLAKYSSPEYHTNNLLNSVLFEDALKHIPSDAIAIEIAPHGLLQAIIKGALPDTVTNIPLTKRSYGESIRILLTSIGRMYTSGLNPKIQDIYPPITYPVSRGTPSIQSLPFWDHNEQWTPQVIMSSQIHGFPGERTSSLLLNDSIHLTEHTVHGHHIMPLSYALIDVWKMFVEINAKRFCEEPIQFDNVRFKNNVEIHRTSTSESYLMIQWGSGLFEYSVDDEVILSGRISGLKHNSLNPKTGKSFTSKKAADNFQECVSKDEIYAVLAKNGYDLGDNFKNMTNFNVYKNYVRGNVTWKNDWIYFLDGLLKFPLLENLGTCRTEAPVSIRQISIMPATLGNNTATDICVHYNIVTKEITCSGVKISDVKYSPLALPELKTAIVKLEEQTFIQFDGSKCKDVDEFVRDSMDIIMEADNLSSGSTSAGQLVLCTPYHYDDPVAKACTRLIKQIVENRLSISITTMNWDNVKNVTVDDESGRFITVTNVDYLQDTAKSLANKRNSYIIVWSRQKLQHLKDWKTITQRKFNENGYLALAKKEIPSDGNDVFITPTGDDYHLSVWTALKNANPARENVFIISMSEPLEGIGTHVEEMLTKYKFKSLRFLFILDSNAPEFENNKSFYTNQLSKGLIVNVYKNGGWGSYKRIVLQHLKNDNTATKNILYKNISTNRNNKLTVKYLGLNFKHLLVEDNTENEFGPIEYSGVDENNTTVMGITSLQRVSSQIKYDALLSWPVPPTWSLEDATTVPLTYAMSYYVFNVLCSLQKDKSVLVTSGLHPVGQAAIAISLAEKCETYAIVESRQQADRLSDIFPELTRSKVLVNANDKFDIQLKTMTKSKGVDLILNFLSGEAFQAAFRTTADHGKFFHFSKSDMNNYGNIGTRIFLRNIIFSVVTSNLLLNESDHNKRTVREAFVRGLNKGVVKPLPRSVLSMSDNSGKIFETMRTASMLFTPEKVVLPVEGDFGYSVSQEMSECDTYQCHPDRVYVIVARESDWLDVAEWMVDRGAQKIVIAVRMCLMSSIVCRRFNRLISRHVSIQIESDRYVNAREDFLNWLNRLTTSNVLGSIFIVNQFDDKKIDNLRFAFERHPNKTTETSFVCISSKGEHVCAELKSNGLNALNISWDRISIHSNNVSKILLSLDVLLKTSNSRESSSFVCSENGTNKSGWSRLTADNVIADFFPGTADELRVLIDRLTTEAEFVEVGTRSPRYSQQKSTTPVFVIAGFKPQLVDAFYGQFIYPVFEARLPDDVGSVDALSEVLVNKLEAVTDKRYVSLIGESWGGIVALKMAQILEARGTLVTVALIEGDPDTLTCLATSFLANDNLANKLLNTVYSSPSDEFSKYALRKCDEDVQLQNISFYSKIFEENTQRALHIFRRRLQTLLVSKPLSNKLHTKVLMFRYQRATELNKTDLNDYCVNSPFVHIIPETDYKSMMLNKKMIEVIHKSVAFEYPIGVELSLQDKYKQFFFFTQKYLKNA